MILRQLIALADSAEAFFGEPEFDTKDLLRTASDGRGVVSAVELSGVQDRPALFSLKIDQGGDTALRKEAESLGNRYASVADVPVDVEAAPRDYRTC